MNKLFAIAALAVASSFAVAQMYPPTCDPNDQSCTVLNGCNGRRCAITPTTAVVPAHRHGKKAVKR